MKHWRFKLVLPILSVLVVLFVAEVLFRIRHFQTLSNARMGFLMVSRPLYRFDEQIGFRYVPNQNLTLHWMNEEGIPIRSNRIRVNNFGHISSRNDTLAKKKGEFRIAVLGDSLTACIHNDTPWTDALQLLLERDQRFLKSVSASSVSVLNFGMDGVGVEQFPKVLEHEVLQFQPDLILVNFITADIYRRFVWRKSVRPTQDSRYEITLNCVSLPASLSNPQCAYADILAIPTDLSSQSEILHGVRKEISEQVASRIPWLTPYPQFLSWATKGRLESLLGRSPYDPLTPTIETREESKTTTVKALKHLFQISQNVRILHMPTYWELVYQAVPKLAQEVMVLASELKITPMISYMPKKENKSQINPLINYPHDMHWSNLGAQVYAAAIQRYLHDSAPIQLRTARRD